MRDGIMKKTGVAPRTSPFSTTLIDTLRKLNVVRADLNTTTKDVKQLRVELVDVKGALSRSLAERDAAKLHLKKAVDSAAVAKAAAARKLMEAMGRASSTSENAAELASVKLQLYKMMEEANSNRLRSEEKLTRASTDVTAMDAIHRGFADRLKAKEDELVASKQAMETLRTELESKIEQYKKAVDASQGQRSPDVCADLQAVIRRLEGELRGKEKSKTEISLMLAKQNDARIADEKSMSLKKEASEAIMDRVAPCTRPQLVDGLFRSQYAPFLRDEGLQYKVTLMQCFKLLDKDRAVFLAASNAAPMRFKTGETLLRELMFNDGDALSKRWEEIANELTHFKEDGTYSDKMGPIEELEALTKDAAARHFAVLAALAILYEKTEQNEETALAEARPYIMTLFEECFQGSKIFTIAKMMHPVFSLMKEREMTKEEQEEANKAPVVVKSGGSRTFGIQEAPMLMSSFGPGPPPKPPPMPPPHPPGPKGAPPVPNGGPNGAPSVPTGGPKGPPGGAAAGNGGVNMLLMALNNADPLSRLKKVAVADVKPADDKPADYVINARTLQDAADMHKTVMKEYAEAYSKVLRAIDVDGKLLKAASYRNGFKLLFNTLLRENPRDAIKNFKVASYDAPLDQKMCSALRRDLMARPSKTSYDNELVRFQQARRLKNMYVDTPVEARQFLDSVMRSADFQKPSSKLASTFNQRAEELQTCVQGGIIPRMNGEHQTFAKNPLWKEEKTIECNIKSAEYDPENEYSCSLLRKANVETDKVKAKKSTKPAINWDVAIKNKLMMEQYVNQYFIKKTSKSRT